MKELTETDLLRKMAAYCASSEHCAQEVRTKLNNSGLTEEATERILSRLQADGFLDEARFCQAFVNDKLRFNQWGRIKIGYELQRRQIPEAQIQEALSEIDEETYQEVLQKVLKTKMSSIKAKDDREFVLKLMRFAAGRGFESQEVNQCLKQLFQADDEEPMDPTVD